MFDILVVEDDPNTRRLMAAVLSQHGFTPHLAQDGVEALSVLERAHIDLMLLDVMMPKMDGFTLVKTLRENGNALPVLMVTAKEAQADKRRGFQLGTDDYMVKPVDEEEMILRIQALLRRARAVSDQRLSLGDTVLSLDALTVAQGGQAQMLPNKEFMLLFKLCSYLNKIFTRRQLMDEIWDMESDTDERTVDVHIGRLRDRLRDNPDIEIVTVRGLGYKAVRRG